MTPEERAVYLIKELGLVEAKRHADWVLDGAYNQVIREYWRYVLKAIKKKGDGLS